MHLMTDAVAGTREINTVFGGHRLQETVVVGIFKAGLQHIVVNVADRDIGAHARDADGLELEVGHCPRRILRQRLVYADRNLFTGGHLA